MFKARGRTGQGNDLVYLGLTGENVTRLAADEPITFNLSELGLPAVQVVIVYGKTENAIVEQLEAHGVKLRTS